MQDGKTAIRDILIELISENEALIKSFDTFWRNLGKELNKRCREKQVMKITKGEEKIEKSYLAVLEIIIKALKNTQCDDVIEEIKRLILNIKLLN